MVRDLIGSRCAVVVIRVKTVGHNNVTNVTILSQKSQNIGIAVLLVVVKEKREFRIVATVADQDMFS